MYTVNQLSIHAGLLRMEMNGNGRLEALTDTVSGRNHLYRKQDSALLTLRVFGDERHRRPIGVRRLDDADTSDRQMRLALDFEDGITLEVAIVSTGSYARMTILAARDAAGANPVEVLSWGPYLTDMQDAPGEIIGILRSDGFSIGLLSLEPYTDGAAGGGLYEHFMARYLDDGEGSYLHAESRDHTRDGVGDNLIAIQGEPGLTVVGSSVAIFGCATGDELDTIEAIELGEGLPHPLIDGQWAKRSPLSVKPALWIHYRESNAATCIEMARRMGAATLCSFHDMFGNWGHFAPDPRVWPSGMEGIKQAVREAEAAGVRLVMYTLTTFLKPCSIPEPYIAPVPDSRLQTMGPATVLAGEMDADGNTFTVENREGLLDALRISFTFGTWVEHYQENQVVRIDDEILYYRSVRQQDEHLVFEGCRRGLFDTRAVAHARGARVIRMYLNVYRNFFPGTLDMQDEVARNIARVALEGGFGQITFDGHESCFETGHGIYSRNRFTQCVYDRCAGRIPLYTGSNLGNYDWHVISFISWGEFDLEKGFRGTMLDYRIMRQVQLRRNVMPHKMGQYYPSAATLEDIEWLMGLAAGWNSGVDFHIFPEVFAGNPQREAIMHAIKLWDEARMNNAFSEAQQMALRQTDRLFTLARGADGDWALTYKGRWMHRDVQIIPSLSMAVEAVTPSSSVADRGIDWSWTHNPAIYAKAGLSDDLVFCTGHGEGAWMVWYPPADREESDSLQFVLRLAPDAPCAIRNPIIRLDNEVCVHIPVTLHPGQYLSTTHDTPLVCLYDAQHEVIGEVHLRGHLYRLPSVRRSHPHRIGLNAEPLTDGAEVALILNLRTHEQLKAPRGEDPTEQTLVEMHTYE